MSDEVSSGSVSEGARERAAVVNGMLAILGLGLVGAIVIGFVDRSGPTPETIDGAGLYQMTCARCHGGRGEGIPPTPPLAGKPRTVEEVTARISAGGERMPPFGYLAPEKQRAIAEHVVKLAKKE